MKRWLGWEQCTSLESWYFWVWVFHMSDPSGCQLCCTQGNHDSVFAPLGQTVCFNFYFLNSWASVEVRACWAFYFRDVWEEIHSIAVAVTQSLDSKEQRRWAPPFFLWQEWFLYCSLQYNVLWTKWLLSSLLMRKCLEAPELQGYKCNLVQSVSWEVEKLKKYVGNKTWLWMACVELSVSQTRKQPWF